MNLMQKWSRRLPWLAIPNLMLYLVAGKAILWLLVMFGDSRIYSLLTLTRAQLFQGQIWRLFTFIFVPPIQFQPLFLVLELYFLYWIGNALEQYWGAGPFTLYILCGMVGSWVSCLLVGAANDQWMFYALFFAFAWLFPQVQVLLFYVIPVKVQWLGWASAALLLLQFLGMTMAAKLGLFLGLAGFWLVFGTQAGTRYKDWKRRREWQNQWRR
ncbi:MAG: rhomboid family intramembrane serine protease [Candidatus Fournierella pullistercoris]|uniref:Rhomboid family intramembrane serine protease n=1 Tax=Candidatus Allofournierella pullistercoris TaxID=2838597 RepID=A0A948T347_9FIRM|nr:rhomboid family intramembrane serine protease [Candidatus Fournierella pullistercoris]